MSKKSDLTKEQLVKELEALIKLFDKGSHQSNDARFDYGYLAALGFAADQLEALAKRVRVHSKKEVA